MAAKVVFRGGRVRAPKLDGGALQRIGEQMVKEQLKRWAGAIDANGNPAAPLTRRYMFIKRKVTGNPRPKRDMRLTGGTANNFRLRKAIDGVIRAENSTREMRKRARIAQGWAEKRGGPMIGFAGSDQIAVFKSSQAEFGKYLKNAWVPLK